jgi:cell division septation protein DedD
VLAGIAVVLLALTWFELSRRGEQDAPLSPPTGADPVAPASSAAEAAATDAAPESEPAAEPEGGGGPRVDPVPGGPDGDDVAPSRVDSGSGSAPRAGWVVQVGAFRSRTNADGMLERLREVDPEATVHRRGEYYAVVTRSVPSLAEAKALRREIEERDLPGFVRRREAR